jgi:hypothetical protein
MFASKGVAEHIVRGIIGFGALAGTSMLAVSQPWLALGLVPVALLALRGCPMCWTVGLVQTVVAVLRGQSTAGLCTDGRCAIRRSARADRGEGTRAPRA